MIERLELLYARVWREHDLEGASGDLPRDFEWLEFFRDWIDHMRGRGQEGRRAAGLASPPPGP